MPISKTESVNCQQKYDTRSDFVQAQRRKLYDSPCWVDKNIVLSNLLERPIPEQFKPIFKNGLALRVVLYFINHNTFAVSEGVDRKNKIAVDIAESRWTTQQSFADIFGVKAENVKKIEKVLRENILVSAVCQAGWKKHRYLAFSPIFMGWLKAGAEIPNLKKVNDYARGKSFPIGGENPSPPMGKETPHENKPLRTNNNRIYDDEAPPKQPATAPPMDPVVIEEPIPVRRAHKKASSLYKQDSKEIGPEGPLTDQTQIFGTKSFSQINAFWVDAIKRFGHPACQEFVATDTQRLKWNLKNRNRILKSLSEISDPKGYQENSEAQAASQQAKANAVWNRSDWISTIVKLERGENPILPSSTCPPDLKAEFDQLVNKP